MIYDVVIVGGGVAGLTSAIQLKRFGLEPLVLERKAIGGLAINANLIENYPGFPKGISGKKFVKLLEEHVKKLRIEVRIENVKFLEFGKKLLIIVTEKNRIQARSVVLATGTLPKTMNIKGEQELSGRRIFYEISDLPRLNQNNDFVIIGSGDAAFDYALNLSPRVRKIDIVFRKAVPKTLKILAERAEKTGNIIIHSKTQPQSFKIVDDKLVIKGITNGKINIFTCDYAIIAIGRTPNLEILGSKMIAENMAEKFGIFFAGDVKRSSLRQVGVAVGDGLIAAEKVLEFLKK